MRTVAQKCVSKFWMPVFGYEETYQVSENGEFRNIKTNRMMKVNLSLHSGYVSINLCKNGKATLHRVHKLVLISFGYLPNRNQQCRHLDGDKSNNNLGNSKMGNTKRK